VPILCYHNIKDFADQNENLYGKTAKFRRTNEAIHDAGYHSILPNQLYLAMEILTLKTYYDYLDDTRGEQFSIMTWF
jgi:hypothetical protein